MCVGYRVALRLTTPARRQKERASSREKNAVGEVLHGRQGKKEHELTIKAVRVHKGRLLITFEEIKDRTAERICRGDVPESENRFIVHDKLLA